MVFQPNYRFKKAQRARVKESRKEAPAAEAADAEEWVEAAPPPMRADSEGSGAQGEDD